LFYSFKKHFLPKFRNKFIEGAWKRLNLWGV
jgi:hypothetical protein